MSLGHSLYLGGGSLLTPPNNGGLRINTDFGPSYFTGIVPTLNWWLTGSSWSITSSLNGSLGSAAAWDAVGTPTGGGGTSYFNPSTGELANPLPSDLLTAFRNFFTVPPNYNLIALAGNPWWQGQVLNVTWDGTATAGLGPGTGGASFSSTGSNSATITLTGGVLAIANVELKFTMTAGSYTDPPRNVKIVQTQYAANLAAGEYFNPDWAATFGQFGITRWMQYQNAPISTMSAFSQFADASYTFFAGAYTAGSVSAIPSPGTNSACGPKGGIHPNIICDFANKYGCNVHFCVPFAITNACMASIAAVFRDRLNSNLTVYFEYSNEIWQTSGTAAAPFQYCALQTCPWDSSTGESVRWSAYRAAQLWQIVRATYGTDSGTRWKGCAGSQFTNTGGTFSSAYVSAGVGAQYYLSNEAPVGTTLTKLFSTMIEAPYFGNIAINSTNTNITAVTPGATTTVTTSGNHGYSPGQSIRQFFGNVGAGTVGNVLNNQNVTLATASGSTYTFSTISTAGKTYSSNNDYSYPSLIFDIMDQSNTNHGSDPVTYPTKYSYFASEMASSILTGSSTVQGYVTPASANLVGYASPSSSSTGMVLAMLQGQRAANSAGLDYEAYEGGSTFAFEISNIGNNSQLTEYLVNWIYDPAIASCYQALYQAWRNVHSKFCSKYAFGTGAGPFEIARFIPGDETNATLGAAIAENNLGPYVDPTPAATWTATFCTANSTGSSTSVQTISNVDLGAASSDRLVIVAITSQNTPTVTSVTVDGIALTQDIFNTSTESKGIFSGLIPTGSGATHTVVINWVSAGFLARNAFILTVTGLNSTSVLTTASGGSGGTTINETKGSLIVVAGEYSSGFPPTFTSSSWPPTGITGLPSGQSNGSVRGCLVTIVSPFTSPIFNINGGGGGVLAIATYR